MHITVHNQITYSVSFMNLINTIITIKLLYLHGFMTNVQWLRYFIPLKAWTTALMQQIHSVHKFLFHLVNFHVFVYTCTGLHTSYTTLYNYYLMTVYVCQNIALDKIVNVTILYNSSSLTYNDHSHMQVKSLYI